MAQRIGRPEGGRPANLSEVTLIQLYRAEVKRSTEWRTRLDITTNWAITTAAAVISVAFTSPSSPATTLLIGTVLVVTFLVVEARRYRYYDLWARRVRLMENGFLVPLLRREPITIDFYAALASEMTKPRLRISAVDSLAFRLRRTYAPILGLLLAAWVIKLDIHPEPASSVTDIISRARLGPVPGLLVAASWILAVGAYSWLLVWGGRRPLPPTELRAPARRGRAPLSAAFGNIGPHGEVRMRAQRPLARLTGDESPLP